MLNRRSGSPGAGCGGCRRGWVDTRRTSRSTCECSPMSPRPRPRAMPRLWHERSSSYRDSLSVWLRAPSSDDPVAGRSRILRADRPVKLRDSRWQGVFEVLVSTWWVASSRVRSAWHQAEGSRPRHSGEERSRMGEPSSLSRRADFAAVHRSRSPASSRSPVRTTAWGSRRIPSSGRSTSGRSREDGSTPSPMWPASRPPTRCGA